MTFGAFLAQAPSFGVAGIALLLPLFFDPFAAFPFEPAKVKLFRTATLVTALLLGLSRFLGARREGGAAPTSYPLLPAVALLGATQVAATIFSIDPARSWWGESGGHGTVTMLTMLLFFFLVSTIARSQVARTRIVDALLAGSVPVLLYAVTQLFHLDPLVWETDSISPMGSTLGRSNEVGAYLSMVVPFTLARVLDSTKRARARPWGLAALLAAQIACVFLTQARAAWCAAIVGAVVTLYLSRERERGKRRFVPLSAIIAAGMILFAAMNLVDIASLTRSESATPLNDTWENRTGTVRSRLAIWAAALDSSREHWVLGHGPQTFSSVFDSKAFVPGGETVVAHPHNIMLDHLFASGVVGLSAFVLLVASFYFLMRRRIAVERDGRAFSSALVGSVSAFLVQAQFNPDAVVLSVLFWLGLGLGAALGEDHSVRYPAFDPT